MYATENVRHFLDALMDHTLPYARNALQTLCMRKQAHLKTSSEQIIQAWDRDYYCPPEPQHLQYHFPRLRWARYSWGYRVCSSTYTVFRSGLQM